MSLFAEIGERLRALFFRRRREAELDEELRFHLEMQTAENVRRGMDAKEARRRALLKLGGVEQTKEAVRRARGLRPLEDLARELRHALRRTVRRPGFAIAAALTLALGIGANATVFSLVDAILIRPLPYPDADRLVVVGHSAPGLGLADAGLSGGTYLHYRRHNRVFEEIGTGYENVVTLNGGDSPERVRVAMVTYTLFSAMGARPVAGRLFTAADGREDAVVVVISHDLWQRRYGGDPAIVGATITVNGAARPVAGVMEPGFDFPRPETDIWYPSTPGAGSGYAFDFFRAGVARLRPGVSPAEAEADLNRLVPSLADAFAGVTPGMLEEAGLRTTVRPLEDAIVGDVRLALRLLLAGMGLVLLVACANVANLFLVRAERRRREIALRLAIGGDRVHLATHFLAESVPLAVVGGVVGLALAGLGIEALVAFGPQDLPRLREVGLDGRVIAFAAALAVTAGVVLGVAPLVGRRRSGPADSLREGGRAGGGPRGQRLRHGLVAAQVALSMSLLVGSALLAQSFWRIRQVDPGFDADGVLTAELALWHAAAPDYDDAATFWDRLLERIRALPGVEAAGAATAVPLAPVEAYYDFPIESSQQPPGASREALPVATVQFVTPGYLDAMRIPVVDGSAFGPDGRLDRPAPVLLSESLARRLFPDGRAVGRRLRRAGDAARPWTTVAGVLGDVPRRSVGGGPAELLYLPVLERPVDDGLVPRHMSLAIRASVPPASLVPALRRAVRELEPGVPLVNVRPMDRIVGASMARTSFTMALMLIAATAAMGLGAVGIYGVVAYAASRRRHEIGVRMALGARAADVRRMMLGQCARSAAVGIAVGITLALALTRFMAGLLFGVSPTDPLTILAMAALLLAVALAASWLPARRAARTEPAAVLDGA